ncbi:hypothetical protein Mal64_10830 [Pseudobythopirellula maris]|uniref:Protein SlyX n=1 Tax=Pseudobythopirellula maris TaxID=2527991 RepID=A0A5C5ZUH0_9BACT|nr:SlyX family protein [Pseudobythopirellula maris]TWT90688.1 hypothetical protein Mal64_10830 [Pseudobythopirellula maris]
MKPQEVPPHDPTDSRLAKLEEEVAHQQRLLDELNEVITGLRMEVDRHALKQTQIETAIRNVSDSLEGAEGPVDEKPPHY